MCAKSHCESINLVSIFNHNKEDDGQDHLWDF